MKINKKVFTVCILGNVFEWYDFILFGYFSPIIARTFIATQQYQVIYAWLVFALGVIVRPLGGAILGHIGDKYGRKQSLMISIALMAVATTMIGVLPGYETAGIFGFIGLLLARILQGLSIGGEYAGSIVYILEGSPSHKRGLFGSIVASSLVMGMLLGSLTTTLFFKYFDQEVLYDWGWRLAFIIASIGILISYYMRRILIETESFVAIVQKKKTLASPVLELITKEPKKIAIVTMAQTFLAVSMYTVPVYMLNFVKEVLGHDKQKIFWVHTTGILLLGLSNLLSGWLSDFFDKKKKYLKYILILPILLIYPLFLFFMSLNMEGYIWGYYVYACLTGIFLGPIPAFLKETFNTDRRYSGVSLTNNLAMAIFGGTAPALISYFSGFTNMFLPIYMTVAALLSFIALNCLNKEGRDYE